MADVFAADLHLTRFASQPQPSAIGTDRIATIAADKDPYMKLAFLPLQVLKEAAHTPELAVAINDEVLLLGREVLPGHVKRKPAARA